MAYSGFTSSIQFDAFYTSNLARILR